MIDPVSYTVLPGKEDVLILRSSTLATMGNNVYDSLGECARKRNLPAQGVESPNFKECRRVGIAVETLLQRDPGALEPSGEAVERSVSRGPGMVLTPEQEERERAAAALVTAVETVAANDLSTGSEARLREILDRHRNAFRRGLRGDSPTRMELLTVKARGKGIKPRGRTCSPIKTA